MQNRIKKVLAFLGVVIFCYVLLRTIPFPHLKDFKNRAYSTRFFDRNGELLYILPLEDGLRCEFCPLEKIPPALIDSFVQAEDKNFFRHPGIDPFSIFRAYRQNKNAERVVSGASTITMQLVRLIVPRKKNAISLKTKIKESLLALWLEIKLSKNEILELYLNSVPFGFNIEGVSSAARSFFGKTLDSLSDEQIETLSVIPRRPASYAPKKTFLYPDKCSHFVRYVCRSFKESQTPLPFELTLSVDLNLVELLEKEIQANLTTFENARIHNGAALVMDNATGEILAWVGNASFFDDSHAGQIDGVLVKNQHGSAMKPFLYALALDGTSEPSDVLPDIPLDFGKQVYIPLNFNNRYNGPVRLRVALASSLNVPAVQILYNTGVDEYLEFLAKLGFPYLTEERNQTGLSLALGSAEVRLYDMTRAFSTFTRDGIFVGDLNFLKMGANFFATGERVFSADTARIMCDILSDKAARELGFGHASVFDTKYPCIFKTGTSNQFQNITAFASTNRYTIGVWMGNFGGETVIGKTGSSIPALVARKAMDFLQKENPQFFTQKFQLPEHYHKESVCALSGMKASAACPSLAKEFVLNEQTTRQECTWHNIVNGKVVFSYPQEYQHWASNQNMAGGILESGRQQLEIVSPKNGAVFFYDSSIPQSSQILTVQAIGGKQNQTVLFLDGIEQNAKAGGLAWNVPLTRGEHTLTLKSAGETYKCNFTVK